MSCAQVCSNASPARVGESRPHGHAALRPARPTRPIARLRSPREMSRRAHGLTLALALAWLACANALASPPGTGRVISTHASPGTVKSGRATTITGTLKGPEGPVL